MNDEAAQMVVPKEPGLDKIVELRSPETGRVHSSWRLTGDGWTRFEVNGSWPWSSVVGIAIDMNLDLFVCPRRIPTDDDSRKFHIGVTALIREHQATPHDPDASIVVERLTEMLQRYGWRD